MFRYLERLPAQLFGRVKVALLSTRLSERGESDAGLSWEPLAQARAGAVRASAYQPTPGPLPDLEVTWPLLEEEPDGA